MVIAAVALLVCVQTPISIPTFSSWNGKEWSGIAVGTSEKDLGKQVPKSKTVGPDPASVRIGVNKKGWIVTAILSEANNKGSVTGITVELEKDEPIQSLDSLEAELGPASFTAYPRQRFSDWTLAVWKEKGIAAAIQNGSRPLVMKVVLAPSSVLIQNLDLWDREPNSIQDVPRIPVSDFEFSVSSDPKDRGLDDDLRDSLRRIGRRFLDRDDARGLVRSRNGGIPVKVQFQTRRKSTTTINGSVSLSFRDSVGDISITDSATASVDKDRDVRYRAESMFDDLLAKLGRDSEDKYRRLVWQTEWRQFTGLTRLRA